MDTVEYATFRYDTVKVENGLKLSFFQKTGKAKCLSYFSHLLLVLTAYLTLSQEDLLEQQKREEELEKYQKEQR